MLRGGSQSRTHKRGRKHAPLERPWCKQRGSHCVRGRCLMKPASTPPPPPEPSGCCCPSCFSLVEGKDLRWLKSAAGELIAAGCLLAIAYILRRFDRTADVHNNNVFRWMFLVALLLAMYVGGRFVDWIVFRVVSRLALVPLVSDAMFYCLALDGMMQHLTWIIVGVRSFSPLPSSPLSPSHSCPHAVSRCPLLLPCLCKADCVCCVVLSEEITFVFPPPPPFWQWCTYDSPGIGITHSPSYDDCFLLLLLLAILAVLRKAFLRHVLRDRLRQQYDSLSIRVMKAKSAVYRVTRAAYGLPPCQLKDLPASRECVCAFI